MLTLLHLSSVSRALFLAPPFDRGADGGAVKSRTVRSILPFGPVSRSPNSHSFSCFSTPSPTPTHFSLSHTLSLYFRSSLCTQIEFPLCDVNPYIVCRLCAGYLIGATTITECLHTCAWPFDILLAMATHAPLAPHSSPNSSLPRHVTQSANHALSSTSKHQSTAPHVASWYMRRTRWKCSGRVGSGTVPVHPRPRYTAPEMQSTLSDDPISSNGTCFFPVRQAR